MKTKANYQVLELEQGSDAWKEERRKWATASDMPAILGVPGAYRSRDAVLREKVAGKEEEISAFKANLFAEGHAEEASIRESAEATLSMSLDPAVILNERVGILASLDGINFDSGVICEFKYSGAKDVLAAREKEQLPEKYRVQVLAQMLVTGFRSGFVFVKERQTGEIFMHQVEWCEETGARILAAAKAFNADVAAGRTNEIEVNDPRMSKLYDLLNTQKNIKEELAKPLALLSSVEDEIDRVKKAVAEEFQHSIIRGNGVEIKRSKPAAVFDKSAAEAAGVDLAPFTKLNKGAVKVALIKETT